MSQGCVVSIFEIYTLLSPIINYVYVPSIFIWSNKRGFIQKKVNRMVIYRINGQKSKKWGFLEMAKADDPENTTHVDFYMFVCYIFCLFAMPVGGED